MIFYVICSPVIACDKREAFAQGSEATKQSIPPCRRYGLLRFARNDGERAVLAPAILIRRNLDQTAIRIPAVDRTQRAAGALLGDRAFLDRNPVGLQMRHDLVRRA